MKVAAVALLVFCLPVTAGAQPQAAPCLRQDMVLGWNVVNDRTLIVTDRTQHRFKVSLMPGCFDLKFHLGLSFRSQMRTRLACLARNDLVIVPRQAGELGERCLIAGVEPWPRAAPR